MNSRNLDLLRSFAVLLVVGFHLSKFFNWQVPHFRVTDFGLLGVMLFFVHTTLVLMLSLERQRARSTGSLWLPFMTRRAFRIYPLAILVVLFVWALKIPSDLQFGKFGLLHQTSGNLMANLLLIQNVMRQKANPGPLWSLPLELQMYLVLPLLFLVADRVRPWWGMILFWCSIVASWFLLGFATGMLPLSDGDIRSPVEALLKFTRFAPCFLPGVIAYKLWRQPKRLPALAWPIFLAFCCLVFVLFSGNQPIEFGWFVCCGIGLAICSFRELQDGALSHFTQGIARYSYGIYLLHYFAMWFGFVYFRRLNIGLQGFIFAATIVILPILLYHTIEAPLIAMGVKISEMLKPIIFDPQLNGNITTQATRPSFVKDALP